MSKRSLVDSIEVKKACSEDWDAMNGSEQTRFCSHCELSVNNLSALTRKQAMRLVNESNGRICVRYVVDPVDRTPVFARTKLYQITRRAGITAGFLGATLAASSIAYAQNEPVITIKQPIRRPILIEKTQSDRPSDGGIAPLFSGYIFDANSAVIPNVIVTLTNVKTNESRSTTTDSDGFYIFNNVPSGRYKVLAGGNGFKEGELEMDVFDGDETGASLSLETAVDEPLLMTMGEVAFISYSTQIATAVSSDDLERVKYLIARGENVNAKEKSYGNITPLFLAVENGNAEIAETLLNFGAKINARDDNRQTPLMRLDEDATAELANLLIRHGARANFTDKEGNTALILAARSVKEDVLQVLINRSVNLDAQNAGGRTALMEAADADNLENIRALLFAGADPNLKDGENETALDLTTSEEIRALLENYGARAANDSR